MVIFGGMYTCVYIHVYMMYIHVHIYSSLLLRLWGMGGGGIDCCWITGDCSWIVVECSMEYVYGVRLDLSDSLAPSCLGDNLYRFP